MKHQHGVAEITRVVGLKSTVDYQENVMTTAYAGNTSSRNLIWLAALSLLAFGGLGAILLTEAAQMINLPRSWVFWYLQCKSG